MKNLVLIGGLLAAVLLTGCSETGSTSGAKSDAATKEIVVQGCDASTSTGRAMCALEARKICEKEGFRNGAILNIPPESTAATSVDVTATCVKRRG